MISEDPNIRRVLRCAVRRQIIARVANGAISLTTTVFAIAFLASLVLMACASSWLAEIRSEGIPQIDPVSSPTLDSLLMLPRLLLLLTVVAGVSILIRLCVLPIYVYVSFFFLPFLLTLPLTGTLAMLWRKPGHFLLLRPFNRRWLTHPLGRILRREVGRFGHIYTLADANIRVPMYVRVPIVFGQLSFFAFRRRKIRKPIHIECLGRAMRRRWIRNLNWRVSRSRVFPVACTDASWQDCVTHLISEVDVILIDISDVGKNVLWEINLCLQTGSAGRTLIFLHELDKEETVAELRKHLGEPVDQLNIFTYGKRGLEDVKRFRSFVAGMLIQNQYKEVPNA